MLGSGFSKPSIQYAFPWSSFTRCGPVRELVLTKRRALQKGCLAHKKTRLTHSHSLSLTLTHSHAVTLTLTHANTLTERGDDPLHHLGKEENLDHLVVNKERSLTPLCWSNAFIFVGFVRVCHILPETLQATRPNPRTLLHMCTLQV